MRGDPDAVFLPGPAPAGTSGLQYLRDFVRDWAVLLRLPRQTGSRAAESSNPAGRDRIHVLRRQHHSGRDGYLADGTQVSAADMGGLLLLVVPLLPGGRGRGRAGELVEPNR